MRLLQTQKVVATAFAMAIGLAVSPVYGGEGWGGESFSPELNTSCPGIRWLLVRDGGTIKGYAIFTDLSGISTVSGTYQPSGQFHMTLTSLNGDGPTGTATGRRDQDGSLSAQLKGPGCSNLIVRVNRAPEPTQFGSHG